MKRPFVGVVVMLASIVVALSGCVSESPEIRARGSPTWEPGFTWTWTAVSEHTFRMQGEEEAEDSGRTTQSVTHTVASGGPTVDGMPVYWLRVSGGDVDGPLLDGSAFDASGLVAVRQGDLAPVATVGEWELDRCDEGAQVTAWRMDEPFRMLDFPLEAGRSWSGATYDIDYEAEVAGTESVSTPAGSFDAIRIDFTLTQREEPEPPMDGPYAYEVESAYRETVRDFEGKTTVWFAPEAQNIVKFVSSMSAHVEEGDDRAYDIALETTLNLKALALEAQATEPLPAIRVSSPDHSDHYDDLVVVEPKAFPGRRVVADREFPINAVDGATNVTFSIEPPVDAATSSVQWRTSTPTAQGGRVESPTLEMTLDTPGAFSVYAELVPTEAAEPAQDRCDSYRRWSSEWVEPFFGEVFWSKTFELDVKPGTLDNVALGDMPVGEGALDLNIQIQVENGVPTADDHPELVVHHPDGDVAFGKSDTFSMYVYGPTAAWTLEWDPHGWPFDGVASGHKGTVTVEARYTSGWIHVPASW